MSARLTLRYRFSSDPEDDFGWLAALVQTGAISGKGGFWVRWQDVEELAASVSAFPFSVDDPFVREWGCCDSDGLNSVVVVGLSITPANKTGDLEAIVRLADQHDIRQRCQAVFRTNYPDTERFAAELTALMRRERDEAVLTGRDIG